MLKLYITARKTLVIFLLGCFLFVSSITIAYANDWGSIFAGTMIEYIYVKEYLKYQHFRNPTDIGTDLKKEYGVNRDERANTLLNDTMRKLVAAIAKNDKIDPPYSWFVNNKTEFNAFCALGHNVSVNIGTFSYLNYNGDELAAVLAHELVHGQKNHMLASVDKTIAFSLIHQLYMANNPNDLSAISGFLINRYMVAKNATLPQEWEADNLSYDILVGAGYNPGAAAAVWSRVLRKSGDNHRNFFGEVLSPNDHPTNSQRIANFSKKLTEYSKTKVKVENGEIYINDQAVFKPAAAASYYPEERAYLIAGNLARAVRSNQNEKAYSNDDGAVCMGKVIITTPRNPEEFSQDIVSRINKALSISD